MISVKDIIDESILLYKKQWKSYLPYMVLILAPALFFFLRDQVFAQHVVLVEGQFALIQPFTPMSISSMTLYWLVGSVASTWITVALIRLIAQLYTKQPAPSLKTHLRKAAGLLIPAIVVTVLSMLAVLGGLLLLIIPGIIFFVWFSFAIYAVSIHDKKPIEALKYSHSLVRGRWFSVFWRLLAPAFVFILLTLVLQLLVTLPIDVANGFLADSGEITLGLQYLNLALVIIISAAIAPLTQAAQTILYVHLVKTKRPIEKVKPEELAPAK